MTEYINNRTNHGSIFFKEKLDPSNGWAIPFVTGHKYKMSWGHTGLDFEKMSLTLSERWESNDKPIYFVHNYTDVRALFDVTTSSSDNSNSNGNFSNNTIPA